MKKIYQSVFAFGLICVFALSAMAQNNQGIKKQVLNELGYPSLVTFSESNKAYSPENAQAVLTDLLGLDQNESYQQVSVSRDQIGFDHTKFQQYYKGYMVEYGTYTIHQNSGNIVALSGDYKPVSDVNLNAQLSEENALEKALEFVGAKEYMWESEANEAFAKTSEPNGTFYPEGELVIVQDILSDNKATKYQYRLAYKFNIYAVQPLSRAYIYVDAESGKVIQTNSIIKNAVANGNAATRYSGTKSITTDSYSGSYRLRDYSRGNGIITYNCNESTSYSSAVDFTDNDNNWTAAEYNNSDKDNGALDAHWGAMMTYDYFKDVHGRNSFDGNGALMKTYVHFDRDYDNAYWNGSVFTFGDGSSFDILTSLDVYGHEFGHAVCSYTANLTYSYESGALNEAFSDIWGCAIEARYAPEKDTWLMGEDLGTALRSLSDPKSKNLPDTYKGQNWYTGSGDNGGVHYNNGPYCYWFYLISVGGSGTNDNGDSYTVNAIGLEKAEKIAYRVESVYMSASSDYADSRTYSIQAAEDLYGADSDEVKAVTNAMHAIGVGDPYGPVVPQYCASKGTDYSYEWIAEVKVGTFTKTTAGNGYADYTSDVIDLTPGQSYAITLTPGFKSSAYNEYWKIWIDYNGDLDFSDAGELVYDAGSMSNTTVNGNMTIASSASGQTRMRVSMKYNGAQTECETFQYGEVEDYTVNFVTGGDTQAPTAPSNLSASNITTTTVDLSWTASTDNVGVTGYDVYQGSTNLGSVTGTTANITGLTANTAYTFSVRAKDAAGNVSAASNSVNVTTQSDADTQAPTAPANLTSSNITKTTVDLSWNAATDNVGVTGYDIYQGSSNIGSVTGTSTQVTGLTAGTSYTFSVRAKDAAGNVSNASNTVNVTTLPDGVTCSNGISSFPYSESFENTLGVWEQATGDNLNWTVDANGTPSSSTGPSSADAGSYYLYVESSTSGTGYPSKTAILNSPCIDLSGQTGMSFNFAYHMYGSSMGTLSFEISTDGANFTSVWSKTGDQGNSWKNASIDLSAYDGQIIYTRFYGTTGSSYRSDMAIDNIEITSGSTPGTFTVNLTMTFDNYPEETSWTITNGSTTVASGGTYGSQADGSTLVETINLEAGCYTFTINDAYGDGMCCSYGNGSYSLVEGSTVLASGGSFTSSESTNFCVGQQAFMVSNNEIEESTIVGNVIYPNPANDHLNVNVGDLLIKSIRVVNLHGSVISYEINNDRIDISDLKSGMYFISIETEEETIIERFIKE